MTVSDAEQTAITGVVQAYIDGSRSGDVALALHGKRTGSPPPTRLSLVAQWTRLDTFGADALFWRGVLGPRDRALDPALVGQPRLVLRRGRVDRH